MFLSSFRGLFSIMIVLHHWHKFDFMPIFGNGYLFVDFFSVLSGYVIYTKYHYINNSSEIMHYYKKRIIRIFPIYIGVISTLYLFDFIYYHIILHDGIDFFQRHKNELLTNILMFFNNKNPGNLSRYAGSLTVFWSLQGEFMMYFLFPTLLFSFRKNKNIFILVYLLLFAIFALKFHSVNLDFVTFKQSGVLIYSSLERIFIFWIMGFFLGFAIKENKIYLQKYTDFFTLLFLFLFLFSLSYKIHHVFLQNFCAILCFTVLLYFMLNSYKSFIKEKISYFLENPILQFFGNISFSLYSWHLFSRYISKAFFNGSSAVYLSFAFLFAIISFFIFENKCYKINSLKINIYKT